jgi:hypothetical protein
MSCIDEIEDAIEKVEYHLFYGTTTMACCLTLKSGYSVVGSTTLPPGSTPDIKSMQQQSREDAEAKLGTLLGFQKYSALKGKNE